VMLHLNIVHWFISRPKNKLELMAEAEAEAEQNQEAAQHTGCTGTKQRMEGSKA
jgi:hypothetical protein